MYEIEISNLEFKTIIGILDFERKIPQRVRLDCKIKYKKSDDFIDYAKVVEFMKLVMIKNRYKLIEDALDEIISKLSKKYPKIRKIKLKITKPDILQDCEVSVKKVTSFNQI